MIVRMKVDNIELMDDDCPYRPLFDKDGYFSPMELQQHIVDMYGKQFTQEMEESEDGAVHVVFGARVTDTLLAIYVHTSDSDSTPSVYNAKNYIGTTLGLGYGPEDNFRQGLLLVTNPNRVFAGIKPLLLP